MAMYLCGVCNQNKVKRPGEICEECRRKQRASIWDDDAAMPEPDDDSFRLRSRPKNASQAARRVETNSFAHAGGRLGFQRYCGTVTNYHETKDATNALHRWLRSLFCWIPFRAGRQRCTFQLVLESGAIVGAEYAGRILAGQLTDHVSVELSGRRASNGTVYVNKIVNCTTGETISPLFSLHPIITWLFTLLGAGGVVWAVGYVRDFFRANPDILTKGALVIGVVFAALFFIAMLPRLFRGAAFLRIFGILVLIGAAALIYFFAPQLIAPVLLIGGMLYLLIRMIRIR